MSPTRPPRGRETAPGISPGAESFASDRGGEAPQGIVRLSDWFSAEDFATGAATPARRKKDAEASNGRRGGGRAAARQERGDQPHATSRAAAPVTNVAASPSEEHGALTRCEPTSNSGGPAYESLFGTDADTRRRPKRERKPATALQRALGLLTRREHSRKELTRKLVSRGVDAAEVEAAVEKLAGAGWQDDRRFAESLVRSRASAGYGPLHIRAELGTHDLPADVREAALDDFEGDWLEIARDLVTRRFARIDDPRQRERKASDFLIRRGFPGEVVRAAARFHHDD